MKLRLSLLAGRQAVALVVTLILLSVILVITLALLAVSRRERASVNTAQELIDAQYMANAGAERAKATVGAQILGDLHVPSGGWARTMRGYIAPTQFRQTGNLLVSTSTNSLDPFAYTPAYLTNLHYDARVPVFVATNRQGARVDYDFRHFLDLNRNGLFETNGFFYPYDANGLKIGTNYFYQSGDPEWIGVLENPQFPHSSSNHFIGRYAFIVIPAGRTLDINTIHNNARNRDMAANNGDGYNRNQGVATFELNLAAFLADLNTNYWGGGNNIYQFDLPKPWGAGNGTAFGRDFDLARAILRYRYNGTHLNLPTLSDWLGGDVTRAGRLAAAFGQDNYDTFADDDVQTILDRAAGVPLPDVEVGGSPLLTSRWPGVESPQRFTTVNSLFKARSNDVVRAPYFGDFVNDLKAASTNGSVYNRYTYYRLLSQLGTDTGSGESTKINLNYKNTDGTNLESYLPWSATNFFMTVADRLMKSQFSQTDSNDWFSENLAYRFDTPQGPGPVSTNRRSYYQLPYLSGLQVPILKATNFLELRNLSSTNVPIYPTNYYNVAVHRLLQMSANLYAATNVENYRAAAGGSSNSAPYLPIVYRPILGRRGGNNTYIAGYTSDFGDTLINRPWHSLSELGAPTVDLRDNFFGLPSIVEGRKGFPTLNEVTVVSRFNVTRKILISKSTPNEVLDGKFPGQDFPVRQVFIISGTNSVGVELLNPYVGTYPRPLRAQIQGRIFTSLMNGNTVIQTWTNAYTNIWKIDAGKWKGSVLDSGIAALRMPLVTNIPVTVPIGLVGNVTSTNIDRLINEGFNQASSSLPNYDLTVRMTNEFSYLLIDMQGPDRVIDVVSMNRLESSIPITQTFLADKRQGRFWSTNFLKGASTSGNGGTAVRFGVAEQIRVSRQNATLREAGAVDIAPGVDSLGAELNAFGLFMSGSNALGLDVKAQLTKQTPFTAGGVVYKINSWQVNDPLLHHIPEQFTQPDPDQPNTPGLGVKLSLDMGNVGLAQFVGQGGALTNNWNIGLINQDQVYTRWGFPPGEDQGQLIDGVKLATLFNTQTRDPMVRTPDDWNFPSGKYPALGWIGSVHRGTPWQSIYLKAGAAGEQWLKDVHVDIMKVWPVNLNGQFVGSPTFLNHPTNDWLLVDLFSTAPSTVAGSGAIGANQDGVAAWSAVLSGIVARTNHLSGAEAKVRALRYLPALMGFSSVQPAMGDTNSPVHRIVEGINRTRAFAPHGTFESVGQILATPELTVASPFLRVADPKDLKRQDYCYGVNDEAYEWIPRQILSLVRSDEPRYVVYSYGQALRPAADSLIKDPVSPFYNVVTNYQITAEAATKTVFRFETEGSVITTSPIRPKELRLRPVVESFESLPDESF